MRKISFNAGPAVMPLPVLERAKAELLDFEGTGLSMLEHSHRGPEYDKVHQDVLQLFAELLGLPKSHQPMLVQGGASGQFAMIPMNFAGAGRSCDYVVTGHWARLAYEEAARIGPARKAGDTADKDGKHARIPQPEELSIDPKAAYVHLTTNNTIFGTQWKSLPDTKGVPLVLDMSSDILSKPMDLSKAAMLYAGAQKNLGPAGLALLSIDSDFLKAARKDIPDIFSYAVHGKAKSIYHTPPTFSVYLVRLMLNWVKENGGAAGMAKRNDAKAAELYGCIDRHAAFYKCPVEPASRSQMNVVFRLPTPQLEDLFVQEAEGQNMVGLKGHRSAGGIRVSTYNAVSLEDVKALTSFMADFAKRKG